MVSPAPRLRQGGVRPGPRPRLLRGLGLGLGLGLGAAMLGASLSPWAPWQHWLHWLHWGHGQPRAAAVEPAAAADQPAHAERASAQPAAPAVAASSGGPPAAAQAPPVSASVRVLTLREDGSGRWLARLQLGDEPPRWARVADVVARGLRVERITPDGVTLRRGLRLERLDVAGPIEHNATIAHPKQDVAPSVINHPPGQEGPGSSGVERAIQRAAWPAGSSTGH